MIDSILGGMCAAIGAVAFMFISDGSMLGNFIGALAYSFILLAIEYFQLDLFIGKPGIMSNKNKDPVETFLIYAGNFIGVMWVALALKLVPEYGERMGEISHIMLSSLHEESWDTVFILSILTGMMLYAGVSAYHKTKTWIFFITANATCVLAQWPFVPIIFFCLWSDNWQYWFYIIPVTLGNLIGANVWVWLRSYSKSFSDPLKPDEYDIADRFHDFVSRNQNQDSNKDNLSHK